MEYQKVINQSNQTEQTRRDWVVPTIQELPRLTDLTLQSFIPGGGIPGGGGSTVF